VFTDGTCDILSNNLYDNMTGISCVFTDGTCAILSNYVYDNMTEL